MKRLFSIVRRNPGKASLLGLGFGAYSVNRKRREYNIDKFSKGFPFSNPYLLPAPFDKSEINNLIVSHPYYIPIVEDKYFDDELIAFLTKVIKVTESNSNLRWETHTERKEYENTASACGIIQRRLSESTNPVHIEFLNKLDQKLVSTFDRFPDMAYYLYCSNYQFSNEMKDKFTKIYKFYSSCESSTWPYNTELIMYGIKEIPEYKRVFNHITK